MSRTLSANILASISSGQVQRTVHLLSFTIGAQTLRYSEDLVTHVGNLYLPHLSVDTGPKYSEQLQLNPVTARLQNITLETAAMLRDLGDSIQGQEATLERLFLQAGETVMLFKGRISEIEVNEQEAVMTMSAELDPTAAQVPARKYSALCVWDFKDLNCGYSDGIDPLDPATGQPYAICGKDFTSCQARGRMQRFPGFLSVTRDLTESIEGNAPEAPDSGNLSEVFLD